MPYDYTDISTLQDRDLRDLAIEYEIPVQNLREDGSLAPAERERILLQLRRKGVNSRSSASFNIQEQVMEYHQDFPDDTAQRDVYMVRVPPPAADTEWYTAYTTPGGAAFLQERGYEVTTPGEGNGVVIPLPRHRRRSTEPAVEIEAPYGRHHLAPVYDLNERRRRRT